MWPDARVVCDGVGQRRVANGLPPFGPVLCNFNQHFKIDPATFAVWRGAAAELNATLWLLRGSAASERNLAREFAAHPGPGRLVWVERVPVKDHLRRAALCHLALDTLHYNMGATGARSPCMLHVPNVLPRVGRTARVGRAARVGRTARVGRAARVRRLAAWRAAQKADGAGGGRRAAGADTLFASVPVVHRASKKAVGRMMTSMLRCLLLPPCPPCSPSLFLLLRILLLLHPGNPCNLHVAKGRLRR